MGFFTWVHYDVGSDRFSESSSMSSGYISEDMPVTSVGMPADPYDSNSVVEKTSSHNANSSGAIPDDMPELTPDKFKDQTMIHYHPL